MPTISTSAPVATRAAAATPKPTAATVTAGHPRSIAVPAGPPITEPERRTITAVAAVSAATPIAEQQPGITAITGSPGAISRGIQPITDQPAPPTNRTSELSSSQRRRRRNPQSGPEQGTTSTTLVEPPPQVPSSRRLGHQRRLNRRQLHCHTHRRCDRRGCARRPRQ